MQLISHLAGDGFVERDFTLPSPTGDDITGVLWSPASSYPAPAPLILSGHGGSLNTRAPGLVTRAVALAREHGFHVAAINAPGHGGRSRSAEDEREVAAIGAARRAGEPIGEIVVRFNASLADRAVPEWRATLDALQALPEVGAGPVGYSGMTLAAMIGIPLIAAEPRIRAAAIGGVVVSDALLETARSVTIPIQLLLPWDDPELSRDEALTLFDALGSAEKTLHANPGDHRHVPAFESDDSARFFARHLTRRLEG